MNNQPQDRGIDDIELRLRNEIYRYEMALKDGAVNSIIKEVVDNILSLERELEERRAFTPVSTH